MIMTHVPTQNMLASLLDFLSNHIASKNEHLTYKENHTHDEPLATLVLHTAIPVAQELFFIPQTANYSL